MPSLMARDKGGLSALIDSISNAAVPGGSAALRLLDQRAEKPRMGGLGAYHRDLTSLVQNLPGGQDPTPHIQQLRQTHGLGAVQTPGGPVLSQTPRGIPGNAPGRAEPLQVGTITTHRPHRWMENEQNIAAVTTSALNKGVRQGEETAALGGLSKRRKKALIYLMDLPQSFQAEVARSSREMGAPPVTVWDPQELNKRERQLLRGLQMQGKREEKQRKEEQGRQEMIALAGDQQAQAEQQQMGAQLTDAERALVAGRQ